MMLFEDWEENDIAIMNMSKEWHEKQKENTHDLFYVFVDSYVFMFLCLIMLKILTVIII